MNPPPTTAPPRPAGLLRVLAMMAYDALLVSAVLILAAVPTLLIPAEIRDSHPFVLAAKQFYFISVIFLYFAWFWLHGGQTAGMRAWRTRLLSADDRPLDLRRVAIRFFAAILSWLLLGGGYLWILVDRERRSLHDRLSRTRLVVTPRPGKKA